MSNYNNERNNEVHLLMITNGDCNWHYLAVKSISGLLRRISSNYKGDFHCLSCLHSRTTKEKLRKHESICNDHNFCHSKMPDEKILKYVPGKSVKSTIYYLC